MSWESDGGAQPEPERDRTRLVWGVVIAVVVVMLGILALTTRQENASQSRAYVKHIYIPFDRTTPGDRDRALELVSDIRRRILNGEITFEEAARKYSSEGKIAQNGGHLGWTTQKDYAEGKAKEFVWKGPVGQLSNILESSKGFHLIFVEQRELSAADAYERELEQRVFEKEEQQKQSEK